MAIAVTPTNVHWNYFLALEHDMELVSRYIEFCEPNFQVFSIELAHLLFAAASEVDVVAKLLCKCVDPAASCGNINHYKAVLVRAIPDLPHTEIFVPRYGLSFKPWLNWADDTNPEWWGSYNSVKHNRDAHFKEATLKNALNALGALLILTLHLYSRTLAMPPKNVLDPKDTMEQLKPRSTLLRFHERFYYSPLLSVDRLSPLP